MWTEVDLNLWQMQPQFEMLQLLNYCRQYLGNILWA